MRWARKIILVLGSVAGAPPAGGEDPIKSDGSDLGITIMGAIVQKNSDDNVALVKDSTGKVLAVKRDYYILNHYRVTAVHAEFIELVGDDHKRYQVYQDKFAAAALGAKKTDSVLTIPLPDGIDHYGEEGFERNKGKISMTTMYRDRLIKDDLARVLMQATAEPYLENGAIVGFRMSQIDAASIYTKAGILNGDIITAINGAELNSVATAIALLNSLKTAEHVEVDIRRGGGTRKLQIDIH